VGVCRCSHATAGSAVASTPLLRDPLRGKVYFVKNGYPMPDLFVALRGQVGRDLIGAITILGVASCRRRDAKQPAPSI
jgi:hypothetical protein